METTPQMRSACVLYGITHINKAREVANYPILSAPNALWDISRLRWSNQTWQHSSRYCVYRDPPVTLRSLAANRNPSPERFS